VRRRLHPVEPVPLLGGQDLADPLARRFRLVVHPLAVLVEDAAELLDLLAVEAEILLEAPDGRRATGRRTGGTRRQRHARDVEDRAARDHAEHERGQKCEDGALRASRRGIAAG